MDNNTAALLLAGGPPLPRPDPRRNQALPENTVEALGMLGIQAPVDRNEIISSEDPRLVDRRTWMQRLPGTKTENNLKGAIHPQGLLEKRGYDPSLGYGDLNNYQPQDILRWMQYLKQKDYWNKT